MSFDTCFYYFHHPSVLNLVEFIFIMTLKLLEAFHERTFLFLFK